MKNILFTLLLLKLMFLTGQCEAVDLIRGDSFSRSIIYPKRNHVGTIKAITKIWNETLDGRSRFVFGFMSERTNIKPPDKFLQKIPVRDKEVEIEVADWDSADCSIQKMALIQSRQGSTYLILADRDDAEVGNGEIVPQYKPAPQKIRAFVLTRTNDEIGSYPISFSKVFETKIDIPACTGNEIYSLIQRLVINKLK